MNERIKQFAEQAGALPAKQILNVPGDLVLIGEEEIAKFAELIVEECIGICEQAIQQSQQTRDLLQEDELAEKMVIHGSIAQAEKLVQGIKQHFGVER